MGLLQKVHSIDCLIPAALQSVYPHHKWDPSKFIGPQLRLGYRYWCDTNNQRAFFDNLAKKLNIKHYTQWYRVPLSTIKQLGGISLIQYHYGSSLIKGTDQQWVHALQR